MVVTDQHRVAEIARDIEQAGAFALDLEFVSESRYVPELCLMQVAWGDPDDPEMAALDPLEVDCRPVADLVASPRIETVFHAAQADLALLAYRFDTVPVAVYDTQIAAAFLGLGEQIGYANLMASLLDVQIDKGHQYTDWCRRPLSPEQLSYALDDVRYLGRAWTLMRGDLEDAGRLAWVEEETELHAAKASTRIPPEERYRRVKGWNRLKGKQLGALRGLAAWRERLALDENRPPSWIVGDRPLLEIARHRPANPGALGRIRGIKETVVQRHGKEILRAMTEGEADPPDREHRGHAPPDQVKSWSVLLAGIVTARAHQAGVARRYVATRDDVEALARWWAEGDRNAPPELDVLSGWRYELAGASLLAWLSGETSIAVDDESEAGIRLVDEGA
jgi:ribonuclease D